MKRNFLTVILLISVSSLFAQSDLHAIIRDAKGVSQHFTSLTTTNQIPFSGADANGLLGLDDHSNLVLVRSEADKLGFVHYRYYQTYDGIPVENTMYIIHTKNNLLMGMSGSIVVDFDPQMQTRNTASLSHVDAVNAAIINAGAVKYMWQDAEMESRLKEQTANQHATYYPSATLVWYNAGNQINPRALVLAYKVDIYAQEPLSRDYYFVDANTGKVLGKKAELHTSDATGTANTAYSGTQTIHSDLYNGSYRLRDYTKGNGIITRKGSSGNPDYTSSSANWSLSGTDQAAMDVHYGVSSTWSFYNDVFGRNSLDGSGLALNSYVNVSGTVDNAYWDGSAMNFGTRSNGANGGVTGIDVCGHELTHGVTQYTSGLDYSDEPGAMNESMSDIMGKCVQFYAKPADINWKLSNDMNWYIRDMSNPNAYGQPDTYLGTYWYTGSGDYGGVHYNSGVGNFMFYLLVNGGSGTNDIGDAYTVSGIGQSEAEQIIYRTETTYLVSSSQYDDWRAACINAATDLYGSSSNEVTQVENAWYAVGIGTAGGGGGTCNTPTGLSASSVTSSSATLNWSAASGATSYNVRYKPSSSGTWTNTTSTGTSKSVSGLSASTQYDFQVQSVCSGGSTSSYSSTTNFTTSGSGGVTYCTTGGTDQSYEYVDYVSLGSISRSSGADGGYYDGSALSTSVSQGISYTITTSAGFTSGSYGEDWAVYVDWNGDGDFSDANETAATFSSSGSGNNTATISVPSTATVGSTRMRVSMEYGATPAACGSYTYGETEDYSLDVQTGGGGGGSCSENNEPTNNKKSKAVSIAVGTDLLSQISSSTDVDWFAFSNTSGAKNIQVNLTTLPLDYDIKLYSPSGSKLATSQNSGTTDEQINYNTSTVGLYKVKIYGYAGNYSTSSCYTLRVNISSSPFRLADESLSSKQELTLYPVPASNNLNVSFSADEDGMATVSVINSIGQKVFVSVNEVNAGVNTMQLDLNRFANGIYFVEVNQDGDLLKGRFVIQK